MKNKYQTVTYNCLLNVELNNAAKRFVFDEKTAEEFILLLPATLPFKSVDTPRMNGLHICMCMLTLAID